ncbi:MAG: GNAT family N-acetyltransferase [Defluviitaleaceae bacterium]|nr:GNAT family N-acetyltransferase [Defluviitaleaceae bacterium]
MTIVKTKQYKPFQLNDEQAKQLSHPDKIQNALQSDDCMGFYLVDDSINIGFALVRRFAGNQFFLWNFVIDRRHQGMGKGKAFLGLLINSLKTIHNAKTITTTYIYGNEAAKRLYESFGFKQTDIVCENNVHEVNMIYLGCGHSR